MRIVFARSDNGDLPRFARRVPRLARPALAKQPGRSLRLAAFELARDAIQRIAQALWFLP
jgi:hypothetical protein